jgi:hypothetical protein
VGEVCVRSLYNVRAFTPNEQVVSISRIFIRLCAWGLFTSKLDLNLRKKLVKCYILSMALYGAENWTLRKVDQKYWNVLKCGAGEGWRRSFGPIV